jgi:hypothetical protein
MLNKVSVIVPDAQSKLPPTWHVVIAANPTVVNQSDSINYFISADLVTSDEQ